MSFKPVIEELSGTCQDLGLNIEHLEADVRARRQSLELLEKSLAEARADYLVWIEATEILIKIEDRRFKALHGPQPAPKEPLDSVEKDAVKV